MSKNPRVMALRFRIWQFAQPRGWNVTACEIAEGLSNVTSHHVAITLHSAGWAGRVAKPNRLSRTKYDLAALLETKTAFHEIAGAGDGGPLRETTA